MPIIISCTRVTVWFLSFASDFIGSNQLMSAYLSMHLTASYVTLKQVLSDSHICNEGM